MKKQYAASRAHVWAFCEPSEDLQRAAKNPFKKQTPEQAEGVAIHAAIHAAFDDRVQLTHEQKEIIAASDDAESVIQFCVDAVFRLFQNNKGGLTRYILKRSPTTKIKIFRSPPVLT